MSSVVGTPLFLFALSLAHTESRNICPTHSCSSPFFPFYSPYPSFSHAIQCRNCPLISSILIRICMLLPRATTRTARLIFFRPHSTQAFRGSCRLLPAQVLFVLVFHNSHMHPPTYRLPSFIFYLLLQKRPSSRHNLSFRRGHCALAAAPRYRISVSTAT